MSAEDGSFGPVLFSRLQNQIATPAPVAPTLGCSGTSANNYGYRAALTHARWMTPPLRSPAITAASSLLRAPPSLGGASLLSASPFELVPFAWHHRRRFPQFNVKA